ncbi:MAG: YjbH domain-containing protein [bacterium]|nr:YjbH domain-containing protein [bacterium]
MRYLICALLVLAVFALPVRAAIDTQGQSGILVTPTAEVVNDGEVVFSIARQLSRTLPNRGNVIARTYSVTIGYLPNIEATARFTDYPTVPDVSNGLANFQDRSAAVKWQVARGDDWSFAIGATDIGGESRKQDTYYGVASWQADDDLTLSAGVGTDTLEGAFGSVKWTPGERIALLAEHDTQDFNYGVELTPIKGVRLKASMINDHPSLSAGYSFPLNPRNPETPCCPVEIPRCETVYADHCDQAAAVRDALVAESFENVLVGSDGETLFVEFENRRWREQIDALGVAALLAAKCAGPGIKCVVLVPKIEDVPQVTVQADLADLFTLLEQPGDCQGLTVSSYTPGGYPHGTQFAAEANKKPGGGDVFLRPTQNVVVAAENQPVWRTSFGVGLTENIYIARSWRVQARQEWPLMNDIEEKTEPFNRDAFAVYLDRWGEEFYVTGTAGYYGNDTVGFSSEGQLGLSERLRIGGRYDYRTLLGDAPVGVDATSGVLLGEVAYSFPELDWELKAISGVFLAQDEGLRIESRRYFGPTELTFFVYNTNQSATAGGFRLFVPLDTYGERKHGDWRAGSAPYFGYQYRTDTDPMGDVPLPGHDVSSQRQRLRPDYVREHLNEMRRGAYMYLYGD